MTANLALASAVALVFERGASDPMTNLSLAIARRAPDQSDDDAVLPWVARYECREGGRLVAQAWEIETTEPTLDAPTL